MRLAAVVIVAALASGCMMGPDYARPPVEMPAAHRDVAAPAGPAAPGSLAETPWSEVFRDDVLRELVQTALAHNFDIRMAAERVVQARERLGIARSALFPEVEAGVSTAANRRSEVGSTIVPPGVPAQVEWGRADFAVRWEIDVWGRVRRLNEAARAEFLATEEARRAVVTTLVADVSATYLELRSLDLQLEIARRTRDAAADAYRLTDLRRTRGVATGLDVRQAEQLKFVAAGQIASLERAITQTENALSLLLGRVPGAIERGAAIEALAAPPQVPAGLPSVLLERRPDIRQAEQELIAANAQIGVARAQFFPRIALTGVFGVESRSLSDLLTSRAAVWNAGASAVAPIFNAGRLRSNVRLAESVQRELVVNYERSIYGALREVADALAGYRKTTEQRAAQEELVASLREATRLSNQRYQGGLDSYLPVLDAQRSLFLNELGLADLRRQELQAIVELYRALGGGWSDAAPAANPVP